MMLRMRKIKRFGKGFAGLGGSKSAHSCLILEHVLWQTCASRACDEGENYSKYQIIVKMSVTMIVMLVKNDYCCGVNLDLLLS